MKSDGASFSYAVFSFSVDEARGTSIPVGVALWSSQREWVDIRLVEEGDKLADFSRLLHYPFVNFVREKVKNWIGSGQLPYSKEKVSPWEDHWWEHVRELLIHRVRISEARPIDCHDPGKEIGPLFDSIVAPSKPLGDVNTRIDGHIRECLGNLSDKFQYHASLPGYGDRKVRVMRAYHGAQGWVIVEGVNLATENAESQSDAVASKLQRLIEGLQEQCEVIVGYLPPEGGLNGESVLINWIHRVTQAKIFDVKRDRDNLRHEATRLMAKVDGQGYAL
jgi:hypothetical protein